MGLDALSAVTTLLQRLRLADPAAGSFDAGEMQWWWRTPRATDELPQPFWFDDTGPVAAAIATAWTNDVSLTLIGPPRARVEDQMMMVDRALKHWHNHGIEKMSIEVDHNDDGLQALLTDRGFVFDEPGLAETWLEVAERTTIRPLADGYRLSTRAASTDRPHHMIHRGRNHQDLESRLQQTSLYRAELDLVVYTDRPGEPDTVAAYGLFWFDPITATGVVEPMRTEDDHQRRGLARHVLTAGIDRLAQLGAERIKICHELDHSASQNLYLGVGFVPTRATEMWSGPTDLQRLLP